MSGVIDVLVAALLLASSVFAMLAGVGLHRFESVYARMHAATKPATFGLLIVLTATAIHFGEAGVAAKLALVLLLQFATAPIAAHAVARAAHRAGEPMGSTAVMDDLAEDGSDRGLDGSGE